MPLAVIRGGLIASCQPVVGGPMDTPEIVTALSLACLDGGAVALRIEGADRIRAVRSATKAPIIGIRKRDLDNSQVRITPFVEDVEDLVLAGADIVAFDATDRARPVPVENLLDAIHAADTIAMADCATYGEGVHLTELGADMVGTTLAGYISGDEPEVPDIALVAALAKISSHVIAEGCYRTPEQAAQAIACGAYAVVVGSAITRPEHITSWFTQAVTGAFEQKIA